MIRLITQEATDGVRMATMTVAKGVLKASFQRVEFVWIDREYVCNRIVGNRSGLWVLHDSAEWMMDNAMNI